MVAAKRVTMWFTWGALVRGVPIKLRHADTNVLLERNKEGADNWHLGAVEALPRIGNIDVERGTLRYRDAKAEADLTLAVQSMPATGESRATLRF